MLVTVSAQQGLARAQSEKNLTLNWVLGGLRGEEKGKLITSVLFSVKSNDLSFRKDCVVL